MAYDREKLIEKSLEAIEEHKLIFLSEVIAFLPCSSSTFYNNELEKVEEIKEALNNQKIRAKVSMRRKWYNSESATLQMGFYKIVGTDHEAHRLNGSKQVVSQETTVRHEPPQMTAEEAKKYLDDADIA